MFGETNERSRRINDILDLSKIEAGRMELDVAAFDLPSAIDDALLLMRERAGRRGITLECHVDQRLAEIRADSGRSSKSC
jgi:signal transduction histidine kinase